MSLVIPKPYSRQANSKQILLDFSKTSQDVSYSFYHKLYKSSSESSKHQSLVVVVHSLSFQCAETTERGFRASFADDVSISRTRALPQQQELDKSLASSADRQEDVLDWDFYLENPPLKPAATIELEFEYGGRSKPIPVTDPWDE